MSEQPTEKKSNVSSDFFARMGTMGELLRFLWKRKLYWLMPLMLVMIVLIFVVVAGGSGALPWLYTLF